MNDQLRRLRQDLLDFQIFNRGDLLKRRNKYNETDKAQKKRYNEELEDGSKGSSSMIFDKRIWRVKDVAQFLDCSIGHIYNLTSDEKIPKVKKGKFLYFIPDEILNWIIEGDLK